MNEPSNNFCAIFRNLFNKILCKEVLCVCVFIFPLIRGVKQHVCDCSTVRVGRLGDACVFFGSDFSIFKHDDVLKKFFCELTVRHFLIGRIKFKSKFCL